MEKRREKGGGRRREGKGERETGSTERVCVRARAREGEGIEERRDPPRETLGRGKRRTGKERERGGAEQVDTRRGIYWNT